MVMPTMEEGSLYAWTTAAFVAVAVPAADNMPGTVSPYCHAEGMIVMR